MKEQEIIRIFEDRKDLLLKQRENCKDKNEKHAKIKEIKMSMTPEKLFEGIPKEFADYLTLVKKLGFEDEPEYKNYIRMFNNLFKAKEFEMDYIYDWVTVKNNTNVLKDASLMQSAEMSQKREDDKKVNSTIEANNGNAENEQKNVINEIKDDNNDGDDNKRKGKNKNEKCIIF